MRGIRQIGLGVGLWLLLVGGVQAHPRIGIGINFGFPIYGHGPCCHHGYYGYYPYYYRRPVIVEQPVVVQPTPIVVQQPAPVVVQPPPVVAPRPVAVQSYSDPQPAQVPMLQPLSTSNAAPADIERFLGQLSNPDERVRSDAVMDLGRMRAEQAVDPLTATLAGDQSPAVRESAARALGLIGSPRALTALTRAAQADADRDVRRSAQFAVEVIQTNPRR
jgi:hypothetical protein